LRKFTLESIILPKKKFFVNCSLHETMLGEHGTSWELFSDNNVYSVLATTLQLFRPGIVVHFNVLHYRKQKKNMSWLLWNEFLQSNTYNCHTLIIATLMYYKTLTTVIHWCTMKLEHPEKKIMITYHCSAGWGICASHH